MHVCMFVNIEEIIFDIFYNDGLRLGLTCWCVRDNHQYHHGNGCYAQTRHSRGNGAGPGGRLSDVFPRGILVAVATQ